MTAGKEINDLVNAYCRLRDRPYAVYSKCAKRHDLTANELFVPDILWFARRLPVHREPRHRRIRYLSERLQILLCKQEPAEGAGQLQAARPGLSPAAGAPQGGRRFDGRQPEEFSEIRRAAEFAFRRRID